jgi:predicted Zn-dependent protease
LTTPEGKKLYAQRKHIPETGGSDQEAIALTQKAIRLSSLDPELGWRYTWIGFVHLLQSRIDEAILWLERGRSATPRMPQPHQFLSAAYGLKGELDRARAEVAEGHRLSWTPKMRQLAKVEPCP